MTFHIITIFPEIFNSYLSEGIIKKAQEKGIIKFEIYDLRDFTEDRHKTVDDTPYGGGPGMVLKIEPIWKCVEHIKEITENRDAKVLLTSAKGVEYTQVKAEELKKHDDLIILCGRYEGVDERVAEEIVDEEVSVGKYVLTGGELPAMIIADSVARLLPGVLGNEDSLLNESHNKLGDVDYPVYTKPENFNTWKVPEVLLSGNHQNIEEWRNKKRNKN